MASPFVDSGKTTSGISVEAEADSVLRRLIEAEPNE